MKHRLSGVIDAVLVERPGAQEIEVLLDSASGAAITATPERRKALNLTVLTGHLRPGTRVLLNTLATEMGLGTGGMDFVVAALDESAEEIDPPGHIIKLRYTPLQMAVLSVEAPESPHHDALRLFAGLDDTPVVCMELHSQLPGICAAAHWSASFQGLHRTPRIAYIMTDSASLPMALSRLIPALKRRDWITATITSGQAFGGDLEAVNLYSALAAAKAVTGADIIVVGPGPGTVGTATPLGFSGIDQGLAINATASLGGVAIAAARISFADNRSRHMGLSHHTITVLEKVARASTLIPLPVLPESQRRKIDTLLGESGMGERHEAVYVDAERALQALIDSGLAVSTMGRTIEEERPFFLASCAAGLLAAQFAEARIQRELQEEPTLRDYP